MIRDARFDGYAGAPPPGDWPYIVDDFGLIYTAKTLYPFRRADEDVKQSERNLQRAANRDRWEYVAPVAGCGHTSVRLSPDTDYRSWRNEYVLAWPSRDDPAMVSADIDLWDRPQGMGGFVIDAAITINLTAGTWSIDGIELLADHVRAQAESKAAKLVAFFQAAMAERDAGHPAPATAYDKYIARQAETTVQP